MNSVVPMLHATEISQLTELIDGLVTTEQGNETNIHTEAYIPYRSTQGTPRASRFLPDSTFSTPHKEPDDPNWPTREVSFSSQAGVNLSERAPRYISQNLSPRRHGSRAISTKIDDHIYTRGYLEGACSDITIRAFGRSFALHRIILDRSPFFSMMFSGPWKDSESRSMELKFDDTNITCTAFEFCISRLYGKLGDLASVDSLSILATAAYLDMVDLQDQCTNWLLRNLSTTNISHIVKFVAGKSRDGLASERLKEACRALLLRDGYEMTAAEWSDIPIEMVADIVSNDAFYCPAEIDRYHFVAALLRDRQSTAEDAEVLMDVLRNDIHYVHMSQAELKRILVDGIVDRNILYKALWDQIDLREEIANANCPVLGICQDEETEYQVPVDDTCYIGDPLLSPPTTSVVDTHPSYSTFPPFRFSAEFDHINDLKEDTRVYSHTVFYAGSYWNIYIHNKVRARKSRQLGVYLHRVEIKAQGPGNAGENISSPVLSPDSVSSNSSPKDGHNLSISEEKRPYIDHRSTISTYFKIYCPSRRGASKIGVTEFRSGPDEFHRSQSWGWKSRGLCAYDERELLDGEGSGEAGSLKFMVVLGVV